MAAGADGSLDFYEAVTRAAKRPASVEENNGRTGSRFYAVDAQAKTVFGSGSATRAGALQAAPATQRDDAEVREVKPGTVVLRGEQARDVADVNDRRYFVLRDDVALRRDAVRNPRQNVEKGPGASGEPIVTFDFTAEGAKTWQRFTRAIAERGSRTASVVPGGYGADTNQHFAIVVDDQIVSVPYIDHRMNPDGIDGRTGSQISGGFTIASARQLASILGSGPLPVALELVATAKP